VPGLRLGGPSHRLCKAVRACNHSRASSPSSCEGLVEKNCLRTKAACGWFYWDQLSLLAQLGITEQPRLFLSAEGF
jgi:hypothetical protein